MQTIVFQGMRPECTEIRRKVFVDEQGFSTEFDEKDRNAWHALLYEGEKAVGTARLYCLEGRYFVGRFAILPEFRGKGYGRAMMDALTQKATKLGAKGVTLYAQVRAAEFYERMGFVRTNEISYDEGVAHIRMSRSFVPEETEKKTLLYIDACVRKELSRTRRIAKAFLNEAAKTGFYEVREIELDGLSVGPLHGAELAERAAADRQDRRFDPARAFAAADRILIAAPFWDMSFPALLKCYIESVCVDGITFRQTEEGTAGLCRARVLTYLTTRGLNIPDGSDMEQAYGYMRAMCRFWGIPRFDAVSAYGLDLCAPEVLESRLTAAETMARSKARSL